MDVYIFLKNVFITGGSGGIGSAIAEKLAECGYNVAIGYFNGVKNAKSLAEKISAKGYTTVPVFCDVLSEVSVKEAFLDVRKIFGEVDILINCAGIAHIGLLSDMSLEQWNKVLGVNLTGAFLCTREAIPHMIRVHSGIIVNISSMWGQVGASCEVAYSAAKAGLIGFTTALSAELAPSGVRVNCVAPGFIDTPMNNFSSDELKELYAAIPMGRSGTAMEIAETVNFLVSEKSAYITGQTIAVNGGRIIL